MSSLFAELKRRNVFKVGAVYALVAWLIIQIANNFFPPLGLPDWSQTLVAVLILLGFPVALVLAWAYELTPTGIERTTAGQNGDAPHPTGRTLNVIIMASIVLAGAYFAVDTYLLGGTAKDGLVRPSADVGAAAALGASTSTDGSAREAASPGRLPRSVAMLPFENLSPNAEDAFFAAGIHEQVLSRLGRIGDLTVIARPSVLRYADSDLSIRQIANELNVGAVGGGSVRYSDGAVRVTAYLVDAATEAQLWSDTYTRPFDDSFAIESDVATQIAAALEAELAPREQRSLEKPSTESAEAYRLYLRAIARSSYAAGGLGVAPEDAERFHADLHRALELDPAFALGYAAKARDYAYSMGRLTPRAAGLSAEDRALLAIANAERALELDPELGLAYAALAVVHRFNWREREARLALEQALALSPNDYQVVFDAAVFNAYTENRSEAVAHARRAANLNPVEGYLPLGVVALWTGNYDDAYRHFEARLELRPYNTSYLLAQIEALRGNRAVALQRLREAPQRPAGPATLPSAAYLYHRLGADDDTRRLLAAHEAFAAEFAVGPGDWALAALSANDETEALRWLRLAAARRTPGPDWQSIYLIMRNLYADPALERPEFVEVRERLGWR